VVPEVWEFEVSGLKIVKSWLGYRMKKRAGKKSSPLDEIRPEHWTARMSDEFLELLVLEATLAMEAELEKMFDRVVAGPCFTANELPTPTPEQRKAPGSVNAARGLIGLMGIDEEDGDVATEDDDD
jgi:Type ISP C-terminal specificity domain